MRFVTVKFIELVVEKEVSGGSGKEPTLVGVLVSLVTLYGKGDGSRFVGDVDDGEGVFVVAEADLVTVVGGVGTVVDDALGVVDVSISSEATSVFRRSRNTDIDNVETTSATSCGSDTVSETGFFVNGNVVAVSELVVMGSFRELYSSIESVVATEDGNTRNLFGFG